MILLSISLICFTVILLALIVANALREQAEIRYRSSREAEKALDRAPYKRLP